MLQASVREVNMQIFASNHRQKDTPYITQMYNKIYSNINKYMALSRMYHFNMHMIKLHASMCYHMNPCTENANMSGRRL